MAHFFYNKILKFNCGTISAVRKEFNSDKPGVMEDNINILQDWVQKQNHFVKKDFVNNGDIVISFEGFRSLNDKNRTLTVPLYALLFPYVTGILLISLQTALPELTEDNYRILASKMMPTKITSSDYFLESYQHCVMINEYLKLHDYVQDYYIIVDLKDVNLTDVVTNLKFSDFRNMLSVIIEGYGIRIKGIYVISQSTMINALVKIVKQLVSAKIGGRISVVKTPESLHDFFPKRLLPKDFGGEQKSIIELFDELNEELSLESHVSHMMDMKQARTNEDLRRNDKFN